MKRRPQRPTALTMLAVVLMLGLATHGFAQADGLPVTLIMRDGTHVPFTIMPSTHVATRGRLSVHYTDGVEWPIEQFMADVGGASTPIPITQIARADLVAPGERTVWRAILKDGRIFDGKITSGGLDAHFQLDGVNQFGASESLISYPRNPNRQPFIGIIFDPDAVAPGEATAQQPAARADVDSVTLRNGDILSGTILTGEFTVQASYGTLTFTSDQLASITIEDAAGKTDQFVLQVGDRVSGVLQNTTVEMTLTTGTTITLEKGNIASITFATED